MNFDRGFIKWQPFNSVISSKTILNNYKNNETKEKPILFPEKTEILNELIKEAYYSRNKIKITIYEQNKIKSFETIIYKINPSNNTIELNNHKIITFSQIININ